LPNECYSECHHIIPKSLGGSDNTENLVRLTAREHFIAHWLLTKMVTGEPKRKMVYACKKMMHSNNTKQDRYKVGSRVYQNLRESLNSSLKGRKFTDEWIEKLKISAQARAQSEGDDKKAIRRNNMIAINQRRKGEKRPHQSGVNNHFYGVRKTGVDNSFFGKTHTDATLMKLRAPKPKYVCQHCGKTVGGKSNLERWHNNNCMRAKDPTCQD